MKTVGIIAEYNPFHNGHAYQIAKAKELADADYCIVVMSGNFVQRGAPAIMDKGLRTKAALLGGADLVIELPVHYACASAEYFASGATALLDKLGVCDALCFGSESGSLKALNALSDALLSESAAYKSLLKDRLSAGASYPQAREEALLACEPGLAENLSLLRSPNNILGLEYLKALKKRGSSLRPVTLMRKGRHYHDISLPGESAYASARAIREAVTSNQNISAVRGQVPPAVYGLLADAFQKTFPVLPDDFSALLFYQMTLQQAQGFTQYFDIDKTFSDRITSFLPACMSFSSFCEAVKTKNTTYTKAARSLLHILLNIRQEDMECFCGEDFVYYARISGFREKSASLLSAVKANSSIPLLSKLADAKRRLSSANGIKMLEQSIQADHIYATVLQHKFGRGFQNEYQRQIVIH